MRGRELKTESDPNDRDRELNKTRKAEIKRNLARKTEPVLNRR